MKLKFENLYQINATVYYSTKNQFSNYYLITM
jgi:hypothetical protein